MSKQSLVKKYVKDAPCKHCKGKGKCSCESCIRDRESNFNLVWDVQNPRPHPHEVEKSDLWSAEGRKSWEDAKKWDRSTNTCPKCAGKGTRPEIDEDRLNDEIFKGLITEHEKHAIIIELGKLFGPYYFQY